MCAVFVVAFFASELAEAAGGGTGRMTFFGSVGLETEDYQYATATSTRDRTRLRKRFDLNGRGYLWDPRFALFDAGVTLQRDTVQTSESDINTSSRYNMLGYRLNTTWFANKPNPLTLYANRDRSTVYDFWSPSYGFTSSSLGARWGMDSRWLGRSSFYVDRTRSESDSTLVPRSGQNLLFGMDANQNLRPKQWGESDLSYGYRRTASDEKVYGSRQRQNYYYLNDRSLFGDKASLSSYLTYFNRSDQWGSAGTKMESKFLGFNSNFALQQTESFRHFYGLGLSTNETGENKNLSHNLSAGANYRFDRQWQATGSLGWSGFSSKAPASNQVSQEQKSKSFSGSAALMYSDIFLGNYLVSGGYALAQMRTETSSTNGQPVQRNTTHSANIGYTRMNSRLYADSLQLRVNRILGEPGGSETNARYSVNSILTQSDMLQGSAEYRRYRQASAVRISSTLSQVGYDYYNLGSQNTRFDFGWKHRFSETSSSMLSFVSSKGQSQGVNTVTRSVQAHVSMSLYGALQWTALARTDRIEGLASIAGRKMTVESDMNYRIGKWQATARYRYRDVKQELAPFKEHSISFFLKRNYDFRM